MLTQLSVLTYKSKFLDSSVTHWNDTLLGGLKSKCWYSCGQQLL
ncbi:hypothetical protein [Wolbachia endosymbiont of Aedes albopictus]|nr:hypothetical protein [Wolbachia endosymbiont of Aedes albopictus]